MSSRLADELDDIAGLACLMSTEARHILNAAAALRAIAKDTTGCRVECIYVNGLPVRHLGSCPARIADEGLTP